MAETRPPAWGERAPRFTAPAVGGASKYVFDTVAGRHVLLLFFGRATVDATRDALQLVQAHRTLFDDANACFFGISIDADDAASGRIQQQLPGIRYFLDLDCSVSTSYGAVRDGKYWPYWLVLDPQLRVLGAFGVEHGAAAIALLEQSLGAAAAEESWAPVLQVPNVFEPELCRQLIDLYEREGGHESGFMRDIDGKTVLVVDSTHKQRRDVFVEDEKLRAAIAARMRARLNPMIASAFRFQPTRMERYLVACYQAGAGHFRAHRDDTTKGTAHRKFAVTINLNAGEYDGGDLRFPEFGPRTYRAPTGGAIVFSCDLLHEATPVTRGKRYAFLPFLYDEEGARVRVKNNAFLGEGLEAYRPSE